MTVCSSGEYKVKLWAHKAAPRPMCGTGLCADTQSVAPFVHNKQLWYVASQFESKYNTPTDQWSHIS